MKVSLIQSHLVWENKKANLDFFHSQILNLASKTDLIVLPEMFPTGFSMQAEKWAETPNGESFKKMQEWAKLSHAAIVGSIIVKEENQYFNRAYFVFPDGSSQQYDKRHLFRMAHEDKHYASGQNRLVVEYKGWRICPLICYDLRFPVWSRNNLEYDLLIYVANWPERRSAAWKTLLKARAIENLSFVAGVNRIGADGNGISHSGDSALIDFKGEELSRIVAHEPMVETLEINKADLIDFRTKFPAHFDADHFQIVP